MQDNSVYWLIWHIAGLTVVVNVARWLYFYLRYGIPFRGAGFFVKLHDVGTAELLLWQVRKQERAVINVHYDRVGIQSKAGGILVNFEEDFYDDDDDDDESNQSWLKKYLGIKEEEQAVHREFVGKIHSVWQRLQEELKACGSLGILDNLPVKMVDAESFVRVDDICAFMDLLVNAIDNQDLLKDVLMALLMGRKAYLDYEQHIAFVNTPFGAVCNTLGLDNVIVNALSSSDKNLSAKDELEGDCGIAKEEQMRLFRKKMKAELSERKYEKNMRKWRRRELQRLQRRRRRLRFPSGVTRLDSEEDDESYFDEVLRSLEEGWKMTRRQAVTLMKRAELIPGKLKERAQRMIDSARGRVIAQPIAEEDKKDDVDDGSEDEDEAQLKSDEEAYLNRTITIEVDAFFEKKSVILDVSGNLYEHLFCSQHWSDLDSFCLRTILYILACGSEFSYNEIFESALCEDDLPSESTILALKAGMQQQGADCVTGLSADGAAGSPLRGGAVSGPQRRQSTRQDMRKPDEPPEPPVEDDVTDSSRDTRPIKPPPDAEAAATFNMDDVEALLAGCYNDGLSDLQLESIEDVNENIGQGENENEIPKGNFENSVFTFASLAQPTSLTSADKDLQSTDQAVSTGRDGKEAGHSSVILLFVC